MTDYLCEICVGGTEQRVWEDEVQEDALGIRDGIDLKALGIMHGFWRVDVRYGVRGESVQELWWGGREQFLCR